MCVPRRLEVKRGIRLGERHFREEWWRQKLVEKRVVEETRRREVE